MAEHGRSWSSRMERVNLPKERRQRKSWNDECDKCPLGDITNLDELTRMSPGITHLKDLMGETAIND